MITLGNKNDLFLDDYLIDKQKNIILDQNMPTRNGSVLTLDKPWEGPYCAYHTVIQHPRTGQVYLYYRATDLRMEGHEYTCLAISNDDGKTFERIKMECVNNGLNNAILMDCPPTHNFAPFYDSNPDCPKSEKFKALGYAMDSQYDPALMAFYSADGIHWNTYDKPYVLKWEHSPFDSLNTPFWDPNDKKYKCYARFYLKTEDQKKMVVEKKNLRDPDVGIRAIQCFESEDFLNWTEPTLNTYNGGNKADFHYYTNSTRPVPDATHQYVAFPMRFVEERKKVVGYPQTGVSDCVMLTSRDGHDWKSYGKRPWIYPRNVKECWTQRNHITSAGIVVSADEYSLYVFENYGWKNLPPEIVRYSVPKMRLGYVYSEDGSFLTKPFKLEGNRLTFNYNTSAVGSMFVDVTDENGTPIDGYSFEIYGNEFDYPIDLTELNGKTLRLSIKLEDAYLYSIGY